MTFIASYVKVAKFRLHFVTFVFGPLSDLITNCVRKFKIIKKVFSYLPILVSC